MRTRQNTCDSLWLEAGEYFWCCACYLANPSDSQPDLPPQQIVLKPLVCKPTWQSHNPAVFNLCTNIVCLAKDCSWNQDLIVLICQFVLETWDTFSIFNPLHCNGTLNLTNNHPHQQRLQRNWLTKVRRGFLLQSKVLWLNAHGISISPLRVLGRGWRWEAF